MNRGWEEAPCALCGHSKSEVFLEIPHPDAPKGVSHVVRCLSCGLRRLDPRPCEDILGDYYGQDYNAFAGRTRSADKQAIWDFLRDVSSEAPGRGRRWRAARPLLRPMAEWLFDINVPLAGDARPRVLDVGCGFGDLLTYLKSRGCEVLGVDLDERAAARGREMGVPIQTGHLRDLHLLGASFDVGILCHSLEHLPDPDGALNELARLIKPGGHLHIAVPNGNAVGLGLEGAAWAHLSHPLHFWFFDMGTLVTLLRRNGFAPIRGPYTTSRHHYFLRWLRQRKSDGFMGATRRLWRHISATTRSKDGGDVLRVVAERLPENVAYPNGNAAQVGSR